MGVLFLLFRHIPGSSIFFCLLFLIVYFFLFIVNAENLVDFFNFSSHF